MANYDGFVDSAKSNAEDEAKRQQLNNVSVCDYLGGIMTSLEAARATQDWDLVKNAEIMLDALNRKLYYAKPFVAELQPDRDKGIVARSRA